MLTLARREFLAIVAAALAPAQSNGRPAPPTYAEAIDDLVTANHVLAHEGILDGFGHVSVRDPRNADRYLLARSIAPELVSADDILEYDLDSRAVDPRGRTSYLERFIHGEIYRARRDVRAVVHCHTPSLIPFADSTVPLRPMYHQSAFVAEGIPVFDIRQAVGMTNMLVQDAARARALAGVLADKPAALMRGHGAVVVADSIPTVVGRCVYLDLNARLQAEAIALGGQITYLDPEEARLYSTTSNYDRAWELWKRKAR